LREGEIGVARSISALRWAMISARVPTLTRASSASATSFSVQLGDQLAVVDHQKGRARRQILAALYRNLGEAAGDAGGDVDAGAFDFTLDDRGRARYQIARPIIARNMIAVMTMRGLVRGLRRVVPALDSVVARPSAEGGAVDGVTSVIVV
jgi:hypothetical protein